MSLTTDSKSKITGKRIAIKNRNFKKMDNFTMNQKNTITKIWDNKFGIITSMRKFTFRNSSIKTRPRRLTKERGKIKFKASTKFKIKIF